MSDSDDFSTKSSLTQRTPIKVGHTSSQEKLTPKSSEVSSGSDAEPDLIDLKDPNYTPKRSTATQIKSFYNLRSKEILAEGPNQETEGQPIQELTDTSYDSKQTAPFSEQNLFKKEHTLKIVKMEIGYKEMTQILPILHDDANSLEIFISKGDLIFTTLTKPESIVFFLQVVKSCTTGSLKLKILNIATWELIKKALVATILPFKTVSQLNDEMFQIKHSANESIQAYSDRILQLTNSLNVAYKLSNTEATADALKLVYAMNQKVALNSFVRGLKGNLKAWVKARAFTEFSEAVEYARQEEFEDQTPSSNQTQPRQVQSNVVKPKPTDAPKSCFKCGNTGHMANYCRVKPLNSRSNAPAAREKPTYFCTFCNKNGHTEDRCYMAKRSNGIACNYCGNSNHTTQNCMRKIADQPKSGRINHVKSNSDYLSQVNISEVMENLASRFSNCFPPNSNSNEMYRDYGNVNHIQRFNTNSQPNNQLVLRDSYNQNQNGNYNNGQRFNTNPQLNNQRVLMDSYNQDQTGNINHIHRLNTNNQTSLIDLPNPNQNQVAPNTPNVMDLVSISNSLHLEPSTYQVIGTPNQQQNIQYSNSGNY